MSLFVRAVTFVSQVCGIVAGALIASAVFVVCHMVFMRYVLNETTIWQTDFVTYSLIAATFIGSPYVLLTRGHVNVDVLPIYLKPGARFWLALAAALLSLAFCLTLTVLSFLLFKEAWDNNWVSFTMWRARLWIPYSSMLVGLGILSLQYVADILNLATGRAAPFGIEKETA
jgi:TRAP-type C4-dicarboxylate transport system permease small subunit